MTLEDVKSFHAQFYGASNAELAIVGDFDADAMRALVAELFGELEEPGARTRACRTRSARTSRRRCKLAGRRQGQRVHARA